MATEIRELARAASPDTIGRQKWLDGTSDQLQKWFATVVEQGGAPAQALKDWLNGVWLGHPLHPALTDVPIGAWWIGLFLDLLGQREGADAALLGGTLAALPTALSGAADWTDTYGKTRRVGLVHALVNVGALACFAGSLLARRTGSRRLGIPLSATGLSLASFSAWLGGDLVFAQGNVVNHAAWEPELEDFSVAARLQDLADGRLTSAEVSAEGTKVPLVLLRQGSDVFALGNVCTHAGGPLAEGSLVDDTCVQCPWHGSWFDMRDGHIVRGPATIPQPAYQVRIRDGNVEVRRARPKG